MRSSITVHRPGSGTRDSKELHRIDEAIVEQEVAAAGFRFDSESDVLRNPDGRRDWSCHPKVAAARRGTRDRLVSRFVQP